MTDDVREDVQATSDDLIADAKLLAEIEGRKRQPDVSADELERLAVQADELTRRMADKARIERKLAEQIREEGR
jgi:hypothetical protein